MDPNALMGMVFTLVLALLIGGFVLLFPLSRRLGVLLEQRAARQLKDPAVVDELAELRGLIEETRTELLRIRQRQDFIDGLLARPGRTDLEKLSP